jgi:GntR family transcriptional regulator
MSSSLQPQDDVFRAGTRRSVRDRPRDQFRSLLERGMASNRLLQRPIYLQVCDLLTERIASGEWKLGQAIPNEVELARQLGVSGGTVRKALELMESRHMLTRRQGRGTFIADPAVGGFADRFCSIRNAHGETVAGSIECLEIARRPAGEAERARLQLGREDRVWHLRRLRRDGDRAFMHERVALPAGLFHEIAADAPHRIVALAHRRGLMLGPGEERISLGSASAEAAGALSIAPGSPVLLLDRVVRTTEGQPVEWRSAECHLGAGHYVARLTRGG